MTKFFIYSIIHKIIKTSFMNKRSIVKIVLSFLVVVSLFFVSGRPLLATTYYMGEYMTAWGSGFSVHRLTKTISVSQAGEYSFYIKFFANGPADQRHEEMKAYIDNKYIGRTYDCGTNCHRTDNLGSVILTNGSHTIRLDHMWDVNKDGSCNSIHDIYAILNLKKAFQAPTADIKANNSDGPVTINYGSSANLTWTSTNSNYCKLWYADVNGNNVGTWHEWGGNYPSNGSRSTGSLYKNQMYWLRCYQSATGKYAYDGVVVNVRKLSPPTVDIKANNSDGPITINYNTATTLTWSSTNANSCTASGDWSGSKSISGSESTGLLTSSKVYTITCTGPGGTASDSVVIYTQNIQPANCTTYISPASPKQGDDLTLYVDSNNCQSATYSCYGSLAGHSGSINCNSSLYLGSINQTGQGGCNIYVSGNGGSGQCSNSVYIQEKDKGTLNVNLLVRKSSSEAWKDYYIGFVPLTSVDLKAESSETYSGQKTYKFDCTNNGSWDYMINSWDKVYSVYNLCNYQNPGIYTAKVRVEKGSLFAEDTVTIEVRKENISVSLTPIPTSGYSPLLSTLKAQVPTSISGPFTYTFWWDCNSNCSTINQCKAECGNWNYRSAQTYNHSYFVSHYYTYKANKIYHPKVVLEKNSLSATDLENIVIFYKYTCQNCNKPAPKREVITISGRVYKGSTKEGVAGIKVYLCNLGTVTTDSQGYWHKAAYKGTNFCVRIKSEECPEYKPIVLAVNNTVCHKEVSTYESQVAGINSFIGCNSQIGPSSWDLLQDNIYDFSLINPYISVSVQATSTPDDPTKINIYTKTSGTLSGLNNFYLWWNCDSSCNSLDQCQNDCGSPDYRTENSAKNYLTLSHQYPEKSVYSLKALVGRGNYFAQDKMDIDLTNLSSLSKGSLLARISNAGWFRSLLFFLVLFLIFFIFLWILRIFLFKEKK